MCNKLLIVYTLFFTIILSANVYAQNVTSTSGDSMEIDLGYDFYYNEGSSITREWRTIHDASLPVDILKTTGITVDEVDGDLFYVSEFSIKTTKDISAFEIRYITFNIWGSHVKNLSSTKITDIKAGETQKFNPTWKEYSTNTATNFYASIAYIAQVRTKEGQVLKANQETILKEAQKFSEKFSEKNLEPKPSE